MRAALRFVMENGAASDTFLNRVLLHGIGKVNGAGLTRLRMKTDTLMVEILPELGGKISSLCRNGVELLQLPLRPYAERSANMGFEESDASGWDECLPSVAACEITDGTRIPDHGEFWRLPCVVSQHSDDEVRLTSSGAVLPLRFERRLMLAGDTLRVDYRLENSGAVEAPYVWSAHPLFAVDEGDVVALPQSTTSVCVEGSAEGRLGMRGTAAGWPVATLSCGEKLDLSKAGNICDGVGDKLYAEAPREGWAALERKRHGLRVKAEFDAVLTPYLGLWLCYGGWPEGQSARQQCVALEPCTAPGDSLADAMEKGWARRLAPGQADSWWMAITVTGCDK